VVFFFRTVSREGTTLVMMMISKRSEFKLTRTTKGDGGPAERSQRRTLAMYVRTKAGKSFPSRKMMSHARGSMVCQAEVVGVCASLDPSFPFRP
jgi:hypothetical protein